MEKATYQIWTEKATKAKLRGGALADAVMPNASDSTNAEAAASSDQRASVLVQSEVIESQGEAIGVLCEEGSATGGDLGTRVSQDTPSEMSDCDLQQVLSDTLRNHYLISVRTPRAWVPIRATPDVFVGEVYTTVAMAIDIPSHAFDLYLGSFQTPRDLRLRDWFNDWDVDVELDLARRPHPPVPNFPRRPLPVLEEISLSESGQLELDNPLPLSQEQFLMGQEDRDVMVAVITNSRSELPLQFYRGTDMHTLTQTYARIKRVGVDRVSPYIRPQPDLPLKDGQHVLAVISKPLRGGAIIFVSIDDQWRELEIHASTTAWELKVEQGWTEAYLVYRGAEVHDDVMLEQLKGDLFEITRAVPATWLRSRNRCKRSAILCLIELLEWFEPVQQDDPVPDLELRILAAQNRWRSQTAWHFLGHPHLCRGGGKQGKLPWESSSSVRGMRMVTEVAAGENILPQIYAHQICKQATGVALTLLSSLSPIQNIEAEKPLLLVFPGHCAPVLRKLGCSPGRIEEVEVILEEPTSKTMVKRKATSLSLSNHQYSYGHGLTAVEWSPSASSEYVVEMG